jgi:hypothetical protein
MAGESTGFDPYEAVLADLKAQRDKIDQAISAIESVRASGGSMPSGATPQNMSVDRPGAFLGMTITEAAIELLKARRQPLRNPEIAVAFKAGGLALNSADPVNTIGAVLSRRANDVGDIVKVGRGTWGLKEWYPGRSFKKEQKQETEKEGGEPEVREPRVRLRMEGSKPEGQK